MEKYYKNFVNLRGMTYSYLRDNGHVDKKAKGTMKYVIKREIKFEDYKITMETIVSEKQQVRWQQRWQQSGWQQRFGRWQQRFGSELHNVFT